MLSGIYYIHEGDTQSKEHPPNTQGPSHQHPHKPTLPAPTQAQHGTPKGCTEATSPKSKNQYERRGGTTDDHTFHVEHHTSGKETDIKQGGRTFHVELPPALLREHRNKTKDTLRDKRASRRHRPRAPP